MKGHYIMKDDPPNTDLAYLSLPEDLLDQLLAEAHVVARMVVVRALARRPVAADARDNEGEGG